MPTTKTQLCLHILEVGWSESWLFVWRNPRNLAIQAENLIRLGDYAGWHFAGHLYPTVLLTSHGKTFFTWHFVLNGTLISDWQYLIRNHLLCLFLCFFPNINCRINFMAKNGSDQCNFYSKLDFWNFFIKTYFLLFFTDFKLVMFHNEYCENFRNFVHVELVKNLHPKYLLYRFLHILEWYLLWENMKMFDFLKPMTRIKLFVHR